MIFEGLIEICDSQPHSAALNMAIDEFLLSQAQEPLLRLYHWERPSVSFGYFEKFEPVAAAWPDRNRVRRWTGGGTVLHGDDVTYSLIVPRASDFFRLSPLECYERIHASVATAIEACGEPAELAARAAPKVSAACFENAALHDIVAQGKKVAGAAQRRTRLGLLHQGSIQMEGKCAAIACNLGGFLADAISRRGLTEGELDGARLLAEEKYGRDDWMRRF